MTSFESDQDAVNLDRRGLLKGAFCVAAASVLAPKVVWASPSPGPDRYILLKGTVGYEASSSDLVRFIFPNTPQSTFIEFSKKDAVFLQSPTKYASISAWLPFGSPIYTSDDPYTPNSSPVATGVHLINTPVPVRVPLSATPASAEAPGPVKHPPVLVMDDGSPANLILDKAGYPIGLQGSRKGEPLLTINVKVWKTAFSPGKNATNELSWLMARATVSSEATPGSAPVPDLEFDFRYQPASMRVVLSFIYKNVQSTLVANCGPSTLNRIATFYGHTFSQEATPIKTGTTPYGMVIAPNPIAPVASRLSAFAPALTTLAQGIPNGLALQTVSDMEINPNESQAAFVQRATAGVTDMLPAMTAGLCYSLNPGIVELARWLGWITVAENASLKAAFGDAYTYAQAYAKTHHSTGPGTFHRLPMAMNFDSDELGQDTPEPKD